ncbi:retrovirus-related pol polyprotein from transposon TNT 1-94 [Tanacetum coccineum]
MTKSVTKTNVSEGLSKPVTTQNLPPTASQAVRNTNVIKPRMYQINTRTTQTRASQLPQTSRNTNPHVSTFTGVIHKTSVSGPQLKSTQMKDKVVQNTSQVKFKKTEVEDHHRISSISNKTKSVIACNDSLKSRILNVNALCTTCGKCVFNSNHDACVSIFLNDVNARSKKPQSVPIRPRKPIRRANQSVATPPKKTITSDFTIQKSKSYYRMLYEKTNKAWKWRGLWFMKENIMIKRVYYVEGLNHNLFLVGQFCDVDFLYKISLQETSAPTPICFMAKASPTQAWLWHRRLSHLNFDTINFLSKKDIVNGLPMLKYVKDQLCLSCELSKAKKRTQFLNKTLHAYFKEEGIEHQISTPRTLEQNGVVKIRNRTLVEAARTMLSASKFPLIFWAEAIATACYTQLRSLIIPRHEKTAYHIINGRKPSLKHLHIFGCTCYITRDGENLDQMKEKGDPCIFELSKALDYENSDSATPLQMTFEHNSSSLRIHDHNNEPSSSTLVPNGSPPADINAPLLQELEFLFSPLFEEYFTAGNQTADAQIKENEIFNIFSTPIREEAELSTRNVDISNMHTFYQHHQSEHRWTKDHPLEQVRGNPSKPVQTRRQLATNPKMCMFALTVSTAEPKKIKEVMVDSTWIGAMQDELHQHQYDSYMSGKTRRTTIW